MQTPLMEPLKPLPTITQRRLSCRCAEDCWSATTNAGVKFALAHQFDYILTINDDCTIAPDHVQVLFDTAQQHQVHILGSRIDYLAQPGRVWVRDIGDLGTPTPQAQRPQYF